MAGSEKYQDEVLPPPGLGGTQEFGRRSRSKAAPPRRAWAVAVPVLLILACVAGLAAVALEIWAHQCQPLTEGTIPLAGLGAEVSVERDSLGVPRIRAASRNDAIRALGFVHGQERFFQMDLLRRTAAGERAELLGPTLVDADLLHRLHQFRRRAVQLLAHLSPEERTMLDSYASGVNAGLASLRALPPEYGLLRIEPVHWTPADSVLVGYTLFMSLQNEMGEDDFARGFFRQKIDPEIYSYLFENESSWNSTIDGSEAFPHEPSAMIKRAAEFTGASPAVRGVPTDRMSPGSNVWAVSGRLTKSGRAMLANDLHLALAMPALWFRAELSYQDRGGARRSVVGVTLPGLPLVLVGSNGSVAWGLTNAGIDSTDLVALELAPDRPNAYRTPDGWRMFEETTEKISVRGNKPISLKVKTSIWGPVDDSRQYAGHPLVVKWSAHEPTALNLQFAGLETADNVSAALLIAQKISVPAMNLVLADAHGNIGWTIVGCLPDRVGFDGTVPVSFADGTCFWAGSLDRKSFPAIVNPESGRIWNANNRSTERTPELGNGGFDSGARARQIETVLFASESFSEQDFLNLQHDDEADYLHRWTTLMQKVARGKNRLSAERKKELLEVIVKWEGHATIDSVVYGLARDFRMNAIALMTGRLLGRDGWPTGYTTDLFDFEEPVWMLVSAEEPSDQAAENRGMETFLADVLERTLRDSDVFWGARKPLAERMWGARNMLDASHPLSGFMPLLGRWTDLPHVPLAGDNHMPLVAGPKFGATVRLVVTPGAEARGLIQVPGGQSGNPFSPHYDDQFETWRTTRGAPLRVGVIQEELTLVPARAD